MDREKVSPQELLVELGKLSHILSDDTTDIQSKVSSSLKIIKSIYNFDISLLYKVQNVVGNLLFLNVVEIIDPNNKRPDLYNGISIKVNLQRPQPEYINEVGSFNTKFISNINVPGEGSDLIGFIHIPEDVGWGYLIGGDFLGKTASIDESEISTFEVICNLLSNVEMRAYYKKMSTYDSLTGLFNSRHIRGELERAFSRYKREPRRLVSIVMCDIDFFKKINDNYGHIQGDYVLREIGELLQAQIRVGFDTIGRYGGEEFLVIIDGNGEKTSAQIIERWRKRIEAHPFQRYDENGKILVGEFFNVTMSFGISTLLPTYQNASEFLADADKALYQAKESGRNRIVCTNANIKN
jgi:diguanylate cyclase (GGDEF)-like protein